MSEPITPEAPVTTDPIEAEGTKPDAPEGLGEGGVKALAAEREARKASDKLATDLAQKLKAFEDRDKTDAERQSEETETLRRENAELKSGALRSTVAATKGVPAALLSGSTQAELEASADALIAFRGDKSSTPLLVPTEGKSPSKQTSSESEFVGALFSSGD